MDSGLGRGRGRGRTLPSQQAAPPPPSPPPAAAAPREHVVQDPQAAYHLMYGHEETSAAPDADRGRSRGRGAGRGRSIEPSRGPGAGVLPPRGEQPQMVPIQDLQTRFEDVAVQDRPGSPKQVMVTPPQEHSPTSVATLDHSPPLPPETPGDLNGTQVLSATSLELGSGPASSAKKMVAEPEEPIISRIGTKGESVPIRTNYLRLNLLEGHPGVVEYNVTFEPQSDSTAYRRKVLRTKECEAVLGTVQSFDGMILFLPNILPNDVTFIETHLDRDPETKIKVSVKFTKVRKMNDCAVFYNILLKQIMRVLKYAQLRREYYDLDMITALDQHKLEVWPGLNLSSENQEGGLMICVDTCSRVLRQDTVYEQLKALKGDPQMKEKFEKFIINKIVMTKYNHKCYKIDDVRWDVQPSGTFTYRGEEVNYVEYLKMKYPLKEVVTDMGQPMLISKLKPRKNDTFKAEEERIAALIPQCCYVTGLTDEQRANFKVMTDLAASTRLVPSQRIQNLNNFIGRLLGNQDVRKILSDWGLQIERNMIDVMGRRYDGPDLEFSRRISLQKSGPDFSREAGKACYEPIDVKEYVLICTQRDTDKAKRFMETYQQVAGPLGIKMMQMGKIVTTKGMRPNDFSDALRTNCNPDKVQFAVIIMPAQRDDIYSAIKRYCVSTAPVPSQCIVAKTLQNEKRQRSIVLKIALQINCKLGGSLWALRLPLKEEIMFIGIDAAHDPLKKDPSVICLVASLNNECTKYYSKSTTSKVHQELGESLGPMTMEALKTYQKVRGRCPSRIVVFRDGGSVGAIDVIWTTEMAQMQKAARDICGDQLKNFSFVLVTKRIAQRFFSLPKTGRGAVDNPQPGTVVDSVVTRRHLYDFYVVSQQVRQGTVNPTHFVVINKNDETKPDLIQRLAYVTCFMYYNWSGTVRVPAMVQYAHKLSALLIRHVKAAPHKDISTTLYYL